MTRTTKYQGIEGMRFYAAFLVYLVHLVGSYSTEYLRIPEADFQVTSANPLHSGLAYLADGHHGVDVFFIISGFLMARIVLDGQQFNYGRFIWNRFLRIYPAFLASLVTMTVVWMLLFQAPFKPVDFLLNLVFANAIPNLGITAYNYVSWSLGYEFAFYFIVPVLVVMSRHVDRRIAAGLLLVGALVAIPDPVVRMKGLFVGALIGTFADNALRRAASWLPLSLLLCAYVLLVAMKGVGSLTYLQFYYALLVCLSALFIKIVFGQSFLTDFFSSPRMGDLGKLSYSFYLWHPLCVAVTLHFILPKAGVTEFPVITAILLTVVSLSLTLGISAGSYRVFESWYFLRRKKEVAADAIAKPGSVATVGDRVEAASG